MTTKKHAPRSLRLSGGMIDGDSERIAKELVKAGREPLTPVAVVESGTTKHQRTTRGTLATIGELAAAAGVRAPAVVVVGEVAALHDVLNPVSS